jgi:hypothetical protein
MSYHTNRGDAIVEHVGFFSFKNYSIVIGSGEGESMIGWYHKEHHTLIFQDPSNFGKHIKKGF